MAPNPSGSICQIIPRSAIVEATEFNFSNLFLRRYFHGKHPNQHVLVADGFGTTAVHNWSIFDGVESDATIVARVQGLHWDAGDWDWQSSFSIVFQNERFKGSTLEVMGAPIDDGEWAIVGGTGQFFMATGSITKCVHETRDDGNTLKLTLHGFWRSRSLLSKVEPSGGDQDLISTAMQSN